MFVRKKQNPNNCKTYVQLVESYRVDGKVRHNIIKHIGTANDPIELEQLVTLGENLKIFYKNRINDSEIAKFHEAELSKIKKTAPSILNCKKIQTKIIGIHDIYGDVLSNFNLQQILGWNQNYYNAFVDIIMAKIASPSSKRMAVQTLQEEFGIEHTLNVVYRMMDKLDDVAISQIQNNIATYNKKLIGDKIRVLFYDVTTIYFESFTSDELKKLGYSKDNKFNQPQIVFTLLVTEQGLPLGYQLLPGNTYEGNTLLNALEAWQKIYINSQFVLVADSGMLNKTNLSTLDAKKIDYIVCARIKNLPKATKSELLAFKESQEQQKDFYYLIEFSHRKLILSYKVTRAEKDRHDREKAVNGLSAKLKTSKNPESLISNYGYKKFINIDGKSNVTLNEEKIQESKRWDGLHGLITNIKDISAEDAYSYYRDLWQVEDAFRINKSDLRIRPVFHWTERRIQAHVLMSYVAYACYKAVEYIVNFNNGTNLCHRQIKKCLLKVGINIFKDQYSYNYYAVPESLTDEIKMIYKTFNKIPEEDAYCCTLAIAD